MTPSPAPEVANLREHELTAIIHREVFDETPLDITRPEDVARWKAFRDLYDRAQRLEVFTPFPLQLDFELNSTCQMRCSFCVHGQQRVPKKLLGFDLFKKAILEGEQHGLCSIKMNYINEPLLNDDLPEYVEFAKAHGVLNVFFASNGQLLTEGMARRLIAARVNKIMVSLDATTPETFMEMRHSSHFTEIIANIHQLIRLRKEMGVGYPRIRVNFLKTKKNAHEAEDFINRWLGVADAIGFQEQVGVPGMTNDFDASHRRIAEPAFQCAFPFKLMVVDSAGSILPCCTFSGREMPMGNLSSMTISEAWNSKPMIDLKQLQQAGGYASNPVCKHCVQNES
jgi:radical SAM protein with 4Fe4S-binding SPASM domain